MSTQIRTQSNPRYFFLLVFLTLAVLGGVLLWIASRPKLVIGCKRFAVTEHAYHGKTDVDSIRRWRDQFKRNLNQPASYAQLRKALSEKHPEVVKATADPAFFPGISFEGVEMIPNLQDPESVRLRVTGRHPGYSSTVTTFSFRHGIHTQTGGGVNPEHTEKAEQLHDQIRHIFHMHIGTIMEQTDKDMATISGSPD